MKEQIKKILNESELSISQTRRRGTNGLRNAGEIAEKIVEAIKPISKIDDRQCPFCNGNEFEIEQCPVSNWKACVCTNCDASSPPVNADYDDSEAYKRHDYRVRESILIKALQKIYALKDCRPRNDFILIAESALKELNLSNSTGLEK